MLTYNCDECKRELNRKEDSVYEIGSIECRHPSRSEIHLRMEKAPHQDVSQSIKQSWVHYMDLHFCDLCWNKLDFKRYSEEE